MRFRRRKEIKPSGPILKNQKSIMTSSDENPTRHKKVLVLNNSYEALYVCNFQRAMCLIFTERAEIIETKRGRVIKTVSQEFPFPSVIRLKTYVRFEYHQDVALTRQNIFRRDNFECQYCGSKSQLTLDHVIPRSKGGRNTWQNLVTACQICNSNKGDSDLEECELELRKKPSRPNKIRIEIADRPEPEWEKYL